MDFVKIPYRKLPFTDLSSEEKELVGVACEAAVAAHAPYSHFHVGCALKGMSGSITTGNNQENAAYPSGLCAERVALFKLKSESKEAIKAMAVVAKNASGRPANAFCCGGCRQVIMEYASLQKEPIKILMGTIEGDFILLEDVRLLMPFGFDAKNLG